MKFQNACARPFSSRCHSLESGMTRRYNFIVLSFRLYTVISTATITCQMNYRKPIDDRGIRTLRPLLRPLVNLAQETLEHLPLQKNGVPFYSLAIHGYSLDEPVDLLIRALFVVLVSLLKAQRVVDFLHAALLLCVLTSVALVKDLALLRGRMSKSDVDEPRALVVDDVGADLADLLVRAEAVEVVVLDLEVLAEGNEDLRREVEGRGRRDARIRASRARRGGRRSNRRSCRRR